MPTVVIALISLWGGLLFGLDIGSMTSSVLFLKEEFQLNTPEIGFVVGSSLFGCALGAFLSGVLSSYFNRKTLIILAMLLYVAGTFALSYTFSLNFLYFFRLVVGLGIGISAFALPLYVAELSPVERRGALVSIYQLAITLGILIAFVIGYFNAHTMAWRPFFFFNGWMAFLFLCTTPFFSKSVVALNKEKISFSSLWRYRTPLLIGILMGVLQQFTGINAVIFYAPTILQQTGVEDHASLLLLTSSIGVVNSLCTVLCIAIIDRVGRKPLLLAGLLGMLVSFILLTAFYQNTLLTVISLMVFIGSFAIGIGPLFWVICSEIFPTSVRGVGMSLATLANWISNFIVSSTFLLLVAEIGWSLGFMFFGVISLLSLVFVQLYVPETRGRSLDSIERLWRVKN